MSDAGPFGPEEPRRGQELRNFDHVDATAHYRQKARRLAREKAFYAGAVVGGVVVFIGLFLWEVLKA